jgi:WD40 repeat protein/DNA-binding SARP family transcriptional activator
VNARDAVNLGIPFDPGEGYRRPVEFRLLGSVEVVEQGNGAISLGGPRQRAVLAHLLLRANNLVPTEVLIDEVWGDEPPEAARNALQSYASHLRKAIGPGRLEGSRAGYVLRADPSEVDTARFQSLLRDAQRLMPIDPKAAVAAFDTALSLWRGRAFGDLAPEPSLRAEAARLDELRLGAMEDRIEALLTIGVHDQVIGELEGLTARYPLRERLWGQLILALYRAGRQAEALGAYQRAREILADELGIDPSPELRKLHERVLQQSPDLAIGGAPLRGYRLLERVGTGSFGTVWRAIQPEVGRDVAVKAIHPHLANDPDFIRRFEAEAQLVARLEHPHVVPLYDYWREPGAAYLVMRFLRGGSLAEALDTAAFEIDRAARLMDQVSGALAAAHRQGVVHRDVKPGNILLDDEGNAYLADFGIAKDLAAPEMTEPGAVKGSLPYLAPEQIRGGTITPRTDVYALGIVLYEVLVGEHPFRDVPDLAIYERQLREPLPSARSQRTDLPPAVDDVIATATAKDPDLRFPDAMALGAAVRNALSPSAMSVAVPASFETRNPYKGLRPFDEADAHDFYGREAFVERLLQRWERPGSRARFLTVVGPSGIGKSSAVRAGLVPAIRRGRIEGSEAWFISQLTPGRHPMEELEAALLRVAARPPAGLLQLLESGPRGLLQAVDRVVPEGSELVLVVDQFEEAFTLTEDEAERSLLLESLRVAAADPASRMRIVATLRADFYDRPLNYPRFGPLLGASTEVMTPLAPDELEQAIVRPAGSVGLRVEPTLIAQVASDVAEQPGALPLVQYALTELFERRDDGNLTLAAYRDIGGVGGALAARGEQLYPARDAVGREAVRQLFLRLVTLGEGVADTRRRVPLSELSGIEVDPEAMQAALDAFGRHRLLTFDRDPATREPTVEVAHEALLRSWPRLREWIDAAREGVQTLRRLADAATEWERSEREPSFLLRGSRLDQFESWAEGTDLAVGRTELGYLRTSATKRDEERAAESARRDHERALERRSLRRTRALVGVFAVAALVAASLTVVATNQNRRAERESRIAAARELAAASVASLEEDAERSVLLAIQAIETTRDVDGTVLREAEEALHSAVVASRIVLSVPGVGGALDWSPKGVFVTEGPEDTGVIDIRDATTGERVRSFPGHDIDVNGVAFSADGSMLATTGDDGALKVWDPATGDNLWTFARSGAVWNPSFSADGSLVAAAWGDEGKVRVLDASEGRPIRTFTRLQYAGDTTFSPDGRMLAASSWAFGTIAFDLASGRIAFRLHGGINASAWSPDGLRIATAGTDGTARLWDGRTGEPLFSLFGHRAPSPSVEWSPDGSRLLTASEDGTAKVWEVFERGGREQITLSAQDLSAGVAAAVFSPDGTQVMTSDVKIASTKVWDVTIGGDAEWMNLPTQPNGDLFFPADVEFLPDGRRLASINEHGDIAIWDLQTGRTLRTIRVGGSEISSFVVTSDGALIAAGRRNGLATAWDVTTGEELFSTRHHAELFDVEWSQDGEHLVTATLQGSIRILDASGEVVRKLNEEGRIALYSARFSPDGRLVVTAVRPSRGGSQDFRQTIWDWENGKVVGSIEPGNGQNDSYRAVFDPTGSRVATNGTNGLPRIWDVETGRSVLVLAAHPGALWDIVFSPDGSLVATAGSDGVVRLFDTTSGEQVLALRGHERVVARVAFSPDGTMLASESVDGTVRIWALDLDDLLKIAEQQVTRTLTDEECRQYLHLDACPIN